MATKFKKGDQVKLVTVVPEGAVEALRMDDNGTVYCLIQWVDVSGQNQKRWIPEDQLTGA